ncbi:DNA-binding response regulator [Massilia dura]|uniref:DNA-binding response regulator n=1 Tax=Pseudoduganella dura TaxID=321982 RepID=A0A6I3XGQ5_9BURK|nr:response regulator transcription factor [Pseudoduganella dura]MUI13720.1 DNA-binding response regulator [Pseudoduganella dura]GGX74933.1 DNA-binding response regulator [Pseudoduganella dura]
MPSDRSLIYVTHIDQVMAAGISAILGSSPNFAVGTIHSSPTIPANVSAIVADYLEGMRLARDASWPDACRPPVLVIMNFAKEVQVRDALDAGVHGYLLQDCFTDELIDAVSQLTKGMRYVSAKVAMSIAASVTGTSLTPRESDVLQFLGNGYCNKVIARELDIGVGTVKSHIKGVMTRLNAKARTEAVVIASQRGPIAANVDSCPAHRQLNSGP